jgi:tight adherence protein C
MDNWTSLVVFAGTSLLVSAVFVLLERDRGRMAARVRRLGREGPTHLGAEWVRGLLARLPLIGKALGGAGEAERARLQYRFALAGIYHAHAPSVFLGVKVLLASGGVVLGLGLGVLSLLVPGRALLAGLVLAAVGVLLPGLWLDSRVRRRQAQLRRGLPDATDLLVLCLEGGVSLVAALAYVTAELRKAHPELGGEMDIVGHEMALGKTAGEAVEKFGQRCGLEEVRTLAAVLLQNERYGVSVARALRVHTDAMRQQRQLRAEEMAQKAAVKILFPTLLCIFPAVFVVVMGPAVFRIMAIFARMN